MHDALATTPDFLYFSFITQTTVGYGDFTAAGDLGRARRDRGADRAALPGDDHRGAVSRLSARTMTTDPAEITANDDTSS